MRLMSLTGGKAPSFPSTLCSIHISPTRNFGRSTIRRKRAPTTRTQLSPKSRHPQLSGNLAKTLLWRRSQRRWKKGTGTLEKEPRDSFFRRFFRNLKLDGVIPTGITPEETRELVDDEDVNDECLLGLLMDQDFEMERSIRNCLVPFAVRYYTGEAYILTGRAAEIAGLLSQAAPAEQRLMSWNRGSGFRDQEESIRTKTPALVLLEVLVENHQLHTGLAEEGSQSCAAGW